MNVIVCEQFFILFFICVTRQLKAVDGDQRVAGVLYTLPESIYACVLCHFIKCITIPSPLRLLFVKNLPYDTTERDVRDAFKR